MPEAARVATVTSRRPRAPHSPRQTGSPADILQGSERARFYSARERCQALFPAGRFSLILRQFLLRRLTWRGSGQSEFERIKATQGDKP